MTDWIKSYSQCGEDNLLWRVLRDVPNGFYIDIGGYDPTEDSVTSIFYDAGWSGINIECNPAMLARFVQQRPRDINLGVAVSDQNGQMKLNLIAETGLTTLVDGITDQHRGDGWRVEQVTVRTQTLADVWDAHVPNGQQVHFLKIDVEGAKDAVIRGADWSRHRPWILAIEALEPHSNVPCHQDWDPLLQQAGYMFVNFDGLNRYYVAREKEEFADIVSTPLNFVVDQYMPAPVHLQHDEVMRLHGEVARLQDEVARQTAVGDQLKAELERAAQELSLLHDMLNRRPRPLWEMVVFRCSGKPKKLVRRILFHKSGKPRGIFRKWILRRDGKPRAAFHRWMYGSQYQSMHGAVRFSKGAAHDLSAGCQLPAELSARAAFMKQQLIQAINNGRNT